MKKKLIMHIGYPKTATTTLQLNVISELCRRGEIEYLNHLGEDNQDLGNIVIKDVLLYALGVSDTWPKDELEQLKHIDKELTVLSCESLSHVSGKSLGADRKISVHENISRLHKLFSGYFDTIEIVMTIRNQLTMIHSYYTQEYFNIVLKNKNYKDFGQWIEDNFGVNVPEGNLAFNYKVMLDEMRKYFGKSNTHVLYYEDLIHAKNEAYKDWGVILNKSSEVIEELFTRKAQNVTVTKTGNKRTTDKQSLGSKLSMFATSIKLSTKTKHFIKALIPKSILTLKTSGDIDIRNFTDLEKTMLIERYDNSNKWLLIECGYTKLEKYNYPLK